MPISYIITNLFPVSGTLNIHREDTVPKNGKKYSQSQFLHSYICVVNFIPPVRDHELGLWSGQKNKDVEQRIGIQKYCSPNPKFP
jgi:hypothetical protein